MAKFASKLRRQQLQDSLSSYRGLPKFPKGYIHEIRSALDLSSYQLAKQMGISQPSVIELEASERAGKITLDSLRRAAEAMDCQLVYALVPNESLEQTVRNQANAKARQLAEPIIRTMALEKQATGLLEQEILIEELANELIRKGGFALWKQE